MHVADKPYLTQEGYLAWEARQPTKHEYIAGEIFAMGGVTQRHNVIAGNLYVALRNHLRGRPCQVFVGEVKLRITRLNAYYYPDVMVACGEHRRLAGDSQVIDDPLVVVEVLSPTTESTDRREKLGAYRSLPTLSEYLMVSQDEKRVEVYRRRGDIGWEQAFYEPGDILDLPSLEFSLPLAALYEGTSAS